MGESGLHAVFFFVLHVLLFMGSWALPVFFSFFIS